MICFLENTFQIQLKKDDNGNIPIILSENGIQSEFDVKKELSSYIKIELNEFEEVKIDWIDNNVNRFSAKSLQIHQMILINDHEERSIQFVLERWQSRMFKVQWKPNLHIEFGLYYEVCEDCD